MRDAQKRPSCANRDNEKKGNKPQNSLGWEVRVVVRLTLEFIEVYEIKDSGSHARFLLVLRRSFVH
jgi:hypothetical protein